MFHASELRQSHSCKLGSNGCTNTDTVPVLIAMWVHSPDSHWLCLGTYAPPTQLSSWNNFQSSKKTAYNPVGWMVKKRRSLGQAPCTNYAMLVHVLPAELLCFDRGLYSHKNTRVSDRWHWPQVLIGSKWAAGFLAYPFNRSWMLGQLLSDQLLYTLAKCWPVQQKPADIWHMCTSLKNNQPKVKLTWNNSPISFDQKAN